jgi:hypothetical protein
VPAVQHRTLLDVDLAVPEQVFRAAAAGSERLRVAAPGPDRVGQRHPVGIHAVEPLRLEAARHDGAPEEGGPVPRPLLVGEAHHLQRKRQARPGLAQPLGAGDTDQHPERPVVAAGIGDGVQVGAEDQRPVAAAVQATDEVPDRIAAGGQARPAHPTLHQLACLA